MPQCTATSKRSGEQCKRAAKPGRPTCSKHGGNNPVGAASPTFKHGRYSKYMPAHLATKYQTALKDKDLLALRDEVALIDSRVLDLLDADEVTDKTWLTIEGLIDTRRRLVDTERKRLVDLQQMMTAEQAMTMLALVIETVKKHINDKHILANISSDLARLVNQPDRESIG